MADIEIPSYKTILPNTVWVRETDQLKTQEGIKIPTVEMLIAVKYTALSKNDALNLIQKVAKDYKQDSVQSYGEEKGERLLVESATMLPKEFLEQIAKGEHAALNHLIEHYPQDDHLEGKTYVQLSVGSTATKTIDTVEALAKEYGAKTYEGILQTASVKQWYLRIMLEGKDKLPDHREMNYLFEKRVRDSDLISVRGAYGDYTTFIEHVNMLYAGLSNSTVNWNSFKTSKTKVNMLRDKTDSTLRVKAALTMQNTARCIMAQQTGGIILILNPDTQQPAQEPEQKDDGEIDLPDFSLN